MIEHPKQLAAINKAPRSIAEILVADYLRPQKLTVEQLADGIGLSKNRTQRLVEGKFRVSPTVALRLGIFFDTTAHYWLYAQADYELACAKSFSNVQSLLPFYTPRDCSDGYVVLVLSREAKVDQDKFDAALDALRAEKGIKQLVFSRSKTEMSAHAKRWAIENNVQREEFVMLARHKISRTCGYRRDFESAIRQYRPDVILSAACPTWTGKIVIDGARRGGYRVEEVDVTISDRRDKQLEALRHRRALKRRNLAGIPY